MKWNKLLKVALFLIKKNYGLNWFNKYLITDSPINKVQNI